MAIRFLGNFLPAFAVIAMSCAAHAQESLSVIEVDASTDDETPLSPASETTGELETVFVTARRRTEAAQDVPISLTVLSGDALAEAGLFRAEDIQQRVPNLVVSVPNTRLSSYTIRGLGSTSFNDGVESSVGLFLDGVYLGRQGLSIFDLVDLESVEVLRGPQGTLFGKNTTAGAINITTKKPSQTFEVNAEASLGNFGYQQYRGSVTGPLIDSVLAGRLTAYSTQRDGLVDNINPAGTQDLNNQNKQGVRGQLLWTPAENFEGRLIAEYGHQDERCCVFLSSDPGNIVPLRDAYVGYTRLPADPYARKTDNDGETRTKVEQKALSVQFDWTLPAQTLTSITAYRDWHFVPQNEDGSGLDLIRRAGVENDHRQFSQEFRISSIASDTLDYTAGLYYLHQRLRSHEDVLFGADTAAWQAGESFVRNSPPIVSNYDQQAVVSEILLGANRLTDSRLSGSSAAAYGQLTWHLTPSFDLTPGLRYTRERKRGHVTRNLQSLIAFEDVPYDCGIDPLCYVVAPIARREAWDTLRENALGGLDNGQVYDYSTSVEESSWSGQLNASYRLSPDVLSYASISRGYKAGGINAGVVSDNVRPTFDPESATSYEIGLKSQLWDRRASLNLAVYQTDVRDYQALTYNPDAEIATVPDNLVNVGKVRLRGVEFESSLRPWPNLSLRAGAAFNRAVYLEFPNAPAAPEDLPLPGPDVGPTFQDLKGKDLYNSPRWTATTGLEYRHPLPAKLGAYGGADYAWRSGYYGALERGRGSYVEAYGIANFRAGIRRADALWDVSVWVRNAFDEDYYAAVLAIQGAGSYGIIPGDPRTYGLTARLNFY